MWGASARAHVHTFERWCLLARSSIADQGVILVYMCLVFSQLLQLSRESAGAVS